MYMFNTKIRVYNDDELVMEDTLKVFLDINDNDEWLTEKCSRLRAAEKVEFVEHSGEWRIEKVVV